MKIKIVFICMLIFMVAGCERNEINSVYVFFISGGQVYSIEPEGGSISRLTNDANSYISVSSSTDGSNLLLSDSSGKMYILDYRGGTPEYLIDGKYGTYGPSGKIYYAIKGGSYYNIIARCDASGNNSVYLKTMTATTEISSLSCNKDESRLAIYYWQSGPSYPAIMDLVSLTDPVVMVNGALNPAYSSLNDDLLVVDNTAVKITHPDTTYQNIYSFTYGMMSTRPAWTPDGEYIYFCNNENSPKEIKSMKPDGTDIRTIGYISTSVDALCVMGKPR